MDLLSKVVEIRTERLDMAGLKANFRSSEVIMNELLRLLPQSPNGNGIGGKVDVSA